MLGSLILYLEGMRTTMFQLSGLLFFFCPQPYILAVQRFHMDFIKAYKKSVPLTTRFSLRV